MISTRAFHYKLQITVSKNLVSCLFLVLCSDSGMRLAWLTS